MKYFVMNEINKVNEFHRKRIEALKNIEVVDYGTEEKEMYIFINNMTYKKIPKNLNTQFVCFKFLEKIEELLINNNIIDIDELWNETCEIYLIKWY